MILEIFACKVQIASLYHIINCVLYVCCFLYVRCTEPVVAIVLLCEPPRKKISAPKKKIVQ